MSQETEDFMRRLASDIPELKPILAENEIDGLLPHLMIADVARWYEHEIARDPGSDAGLALISILESAFEVDADPTADSVTNMIAVSFLENLGLTKSQVRTLGPKLRSHVNTHLQGLMPRRLQGRRGPVRLKSIKEIINEFRK